MKLRGILETAVYVSDIDEAQDFYGRVLGLDLISRDRDRHVFFRCGNGVFLIFNPRVTANEPATVNGASVPPHGAIGAGHMAFRVREDELPAWRARLEGEQITIESEITWPRGGHSIYFRDPAGNSIELASPKLWGLAEDASGG
jgi:catechol 2,3-dioxygenase-like lactoylglutathione lyase family enzyme